MNIYMEFIWNVRFLIKKAYKHFLSLLAKNQIMVRWKDITELGAKNLGPQDS